MKKFIIFIIILVLLALVVFLGFKFLNNDNNVVKDTIDNTVEEVQDNTLNNETDNDTTSESKEYNTTLYVGTEDKFEEFKVNIDKSASVTAQASQILNSIGDILGYKLIANDIANGKGGMTIDFNSSSAPFNTNDSYIGNEQYTTTDTKDLAFTIFDSLEKTLQEYFGQNLDVWFSLDSGSITIDNITIPITEPYQGSNYYQQ